MQIKFPLTVTAEKRTWIIRILAALVILILVLILWRILSSGKSNRHPAAQAPIPVHVKTAYTGNFPVTFSSLGTVTALNTVTVRARVDGELIRILFHEGQKVKAGDLLAKIDPRPFQAQVDQTRGQMIRDQALLRNARQSLARAQELLPKDSIAPQDVDTSIALVRQYEGTVKMDQGLLEAALLQLDFTNMIAPISGKLGLRAVDVGNMIYTTDTTGLVVITQVQPINVLFTVTDTQLPHVLEAIREGVTLQVEAWDRTRKNRLAVGRLVSIDNLVNTSTGTIRLKAEFTNEDDALFPNLFVNAQILVRTIENACIAPTAAVQLGSQGNFVYVVGSDNRVSVRMVETGPSNDQETVITKGISAGERMVIDGLDRLGDNSLVSIIASPSLGTPQEKQATPPETPGQAAPESARANANEGNAKQPLPPASSAIETKDSPAYGAIA